MISVLSSFIKTGIPVFEILTDIQEHIRNLIYSKVNSNELLSDLNKETRKLYLFDII